MFVHEIIRITKWSRARGYFFALALIDWSIDDISIYRTVYD